MSPVASTATAVGWPETAAGVMNPDEPVGGRGQGAWVVEDGRARSQRIERACVVAGKRAMFSAAVSVSVGAEPPGGVAAAKSWAQGVPEVVAPLELTQDARISARVLTSATERVAPVGKAGSWS